MEECNFSKKLSIEKIILFVDGNINLLEEFPLLFFNCSSKLITKKNFLKSYLLNQKTKIIYLK